MGVKRNEEEKYEPPGIYLARNLAQVHNGFSAFH